jgi:hypothetical protein
MKHILSYPLFENVQMQTDIQKLADIITIEIANVAARKISKDIEDEFERMAYYIVSNKDITAKMVGKGFSREFFTLIKKNWLTVIYKDKPYRSTAKGTYGEGTINVHISEDDQKEITDYISQMIDKEIKNVNTFNFAHRIVKKYHSTLVHEIQHAVDDYLSNGKYRDKNHAKAKDQLYNNQNYDDYYKLSHEINARYTQTVSDMGYSTGYVDKWGFAVSPSEFNWDNYLKCFQNRFIGWDLITDEQRKRLISRLSQQYSYMTRNREKLSIDIKRNVERLEKELRETGVKLYMYYHHSRDYIQINQFLAPDEETEKVAMEKIVKLAETYRKTVGLSPYKGYAGIKYKSFIPMLKSLGFVGNANNKKYGGRKDYSISDTMFRYPKRKFKVLK